MAVEHGITNSSVRPSWKKSGSPSRSRVNRAAAVPHKRRLAAEVGDEPEEKRERGAEEKTGDDGKVEGGVFAAVDDVAGQFPEAEGQLVSEIEKEADQNQQCSEENKRAAELAERVHRGDFT